MKAVEKYSELCEYLNLLQCEQRVIPIILIKPATFFLFDDKNGLKYIFDYFNRRSGKGLFFYLPGYIHYPLTSYSPIFVPGYINHSENIAFEIAGLGRVNYSTELFINFIEELESIIPSFRYLGDTELILAEYKREVDKLSFENHKRINLSRIFLAEGDSYRGFYSIEKFLERLLRDLEKGYSIEELSEEIDLYEEIRINH